MNVGAYRDRVTIQRLVETRDAFGQMVESWTDVGTFYADLHHLNGREVTNAMQLKPEATHMVGMRYVEPNGSPIRPADQILYKTRVFKIQDVDNVDELNREYKILCTEVIPPS